ncbi:sugar phosphate isomerase/epimerase family protein [Cohnella faecalis]|uniref:sugar phosphate isomerase/epimerase family protein n=1 Tax=Cohnella faecalis TaxID=2315694 RepID=UPI001F4924CF|nr:TIM barrel protein [Cohnella faecalis]
MKQALADNGLHASSAHVGLTVNEPEKLEENLKQQIEYAIELGLPKFVVPGYPLPENPTAGDVAKFIDTLGRAADVVTAAGLAFGYHNHAFEFKPAPSGKLIIDELLESIPANKLFAEFDLGWIKVAGQDPAAYVAKYAGRLPLVHAKDFKPDGVDTEIGRGTVDWDTALAASEQAGVEYVIIEQERYDISSLESAQLNFAWFKERGWN